MQLDEVEGIVVGNTFDRLNVLIDKHPYALDIAVADRQDAR